MFCRPLPRPSERSDLLRQPLRVLGRLLCHLSVHSVKRDTAQFETSIRSAPLPTSWRGFHLPPSSFLPCPGGSVSLQTCGSGSSSLKAIALQMQFDTLGVGVLTRLQAGHEPWGRRRSEGPGGGRPPPAHLPCALPPRCPRSTEREGAGWWPCPAAPGRRAQPGQPGQSRLHFGVPAPRAPRRAEERPLKQGEQRALHGCGFGAGSETGPVRRACT